MLRERALQEEFDLVGVAPAFGSREAEGQLTAERFSAWIDNGYAGEMNFLKRQDERGELLRRSVKVALPWARSVIVCALNYNAAGPRSIDPARVSDAWIARYAWLGDLQGKSLDYHDDLLVRLRALEGKLNEAADCETKCYVDTGPVLERDFAARAGVGWIGKNTCVLNQELGSWLLLGVIVTSLPMSDELTTDPAHSPAFDRCGSCTRCIDACPTEALIAPRQMDASRCISYLTIEKKGEIPLEYREKMGRQIFGCDICQEVCPWNRRAPIAAKSQTRTRKELINPSLQWLSELDQTTFDLQFSGSPLERTKIGRIHRNVAVAMGNSGDKQFLPRLVEWQRGDDPILAESAAWAVERLRTSEGAEDGNPG